jgi:hypothetical protein
MGALAVALLAVLAALNAYSHASKLAAAQPDPYGASSAQERFAAVFSQVPKDAPLGYISDLGLDQKAGVTAFLAAQYALAPHAVAPVEPAAPAEWAVGNFALPGDYPAAGARLGYGVVADLGRGVLVFRRSSK